VRRFLRAPLAAKLAGANLVIVLTAWVAAFAVHVNPGEWRMLAVMTVAMLLGLAVNLVLVSIALRPIRDLERTATRVWAGDLDSRVPRSPIADANLEQLGGTLNYLITALAEDRRRVRVLASEVVRTGDRERSRLGKELHDSIAQSLAAIRYQLVAIERDITDPLIGAQIRAVRESTGEVLEQVRLLSHTVHPQILDDLGLVPALRQLARKVTGDIGVTVIVPDDAEADLRSIPNDVAAALYRVAQESIANAIRHAAPRKVDVRVGRVANGVAMQVEDDGAGFDTERTQAEGQAMGLFTMRERVSLLGGTFTIVSTPRQGTSVRVQIPLEATASRATSPMTHKERLHAG
jgi:two-component system, NarL family, sensor histidine kinase UhpB